MFNSSEALSYTSPKKCVVNWVMTMNSHELRYRCKLNRGESEPDVRLGDVDMIAAQRCVTALITVSFARVRRQTRRAISAVVGFVVSMPIEANSALVNTTVACP